MITKNSSIYKSVSAKFFESIDINLGNIVPNWFYRKTVSTACRTDTIALLSNSWFLYRFTGQEEHQKKYVYFCDKFNLSNYQYSFRFCFVLKIIVG